MREGGEIVYVALGANLGDREATFSATIRAIEAESDLLLLGASPIYETEPLGPAGQGAYLNAIVQLRAWLSPIDLLRRLQSIERMLGRAQNRRVERWGPREIDLDILFFGDRCLDIPDLIIPHRHAHERIFVMVPMAVLAPSYVHPQFGVRVDQILASLPDGSGVSPWPAPLDWPASIP